MVIDNGCLNHGHGCPLSGFSFVFSLINYFNSQGHVVQSRVSAKFDFRYKS